STKNYFRRILNNSTIAHCVIKLYNRIRGVEKMNKKEISHIRRQFKPDNDYMTIQDIFNVYVQKETGEIYHHESSAFEMLDKETQDLCLENFKKTLTGQVDTKLFTLKFQKEIEDSTQTVLYDGLYTDDREQWQAHMLQIDEKMYMENDYDFDTVGTVVHGEYRKPVKKREPESEEGGNDYQYANKFILCSLNKTDLPESTFVFDYIGKTFKSSHEV